MHSPRRLSELGQKGEKSSHFKVEATGSPCPSSLSRKPKHTASRGGWSKIHSKEEARGTWVERRRRHGGRETLEEGLKGFPLLGLRGGAWVIPSPEGYHPTKESRQSLSVLRLEMRQRGPHLSGRTETPHPYPMSPWAESRLLWEGALAQLSPLRHVQEARQLALQGPVHLYI